MCIDRQTLTTIQMPRVGCQKFVMGSAKKNRKKEVLLERLLILVHIHDWTTTTAILQELSTNL